MVSIFEVIAVSLFVFLVMADLPPDISILLLSGIFSIQFLVDGCRRCLPKCCCCSSIKNLMCSGYSDIPKSKKRLTTGMKTAYNCSERFFECKLIKILAFFFQVGGLIAFYIFWFHLIFTSSEVAEDLDPDEKYKDFIKRVRPMIALPFCLFFLSLIWINKVQEWMQAKDDRQENGQVQEENHIRRTIKPGQTARYKSCMCFILVLYCIITVTFILTCRFHQFIN